jgi:hypothetical protein
MSALVPPPAPPRVASVDDDDKRRLRMRVTQVMATMVTLFATAWVCSLGPIPAIIALMIAKHVLVAIYIMGTGVDAPQARATEVPPPA